MERRSLDRLQSGVDPEVATGARALSLEAETLRTYGGEDRVAKRNELEERQPQRAEAGRRMGA